jgi:hypothetical protein
MALSCIKIEENLISEVEQSLPLFGATKLFAFLECDIKQ